MSNRPVWPIWRIIPARAGFTLPDPRRLARAPDHPRSRGVYVKHRRPAKRAVGSSPLARGLRLEGAGSGHLHRIIPARAGFTALIAGGAMIAGDHPRSRGVYRSVT